MRFIPRPADAFVLGTYIFLSAIPFVPALFGRTVAHPYRLLAMESLAWATAWTLFKRPAWLHWLLLPAFLAMPVEIYLYIYYDQGISTHHLGIIAETSPKEAMEFLGGKLWGLLFLALVVIAWWLLSWYAAWRTHAFDWSLKVRGAALAVLAGIAGIIAYGHEIGIQKAVPASEPSAASSKPLATQDNIKTVAFGKSASVTVEEEDEEEEDVSADSSTTSFAGFVFIKLPRWAAIPFDLDSFGKTWPFGLVTHAYDFWKEREYLSTLANKNSTFQFGAHQGENIEVPQVVVMVIGESSRYDRWSLNGYGRETNPLLKQERNLVSFSNVVTAVSATRLSVPILISRKPATQSLKAGFVEKSFLSAFREAGFKTFWLSNQMSFGQFDTPISVFAKEADVTQFFNLGGFTNASSFDQVLLEPLKNAIDDTSPKKLIVLHTLGSHWNYSHRHPEEFDKWQPSLFGVNNPAYTDLKLKPQLNNSYDNSILYTDWLLSQVIGSLKSSSGISSMIYVADHGQTLYDGTCTLAFHGNNTKFEFHVPALVWYSDAYKQYFPAKVERLHRNRRAKLATENIFHSLLDMADIRYKGEQLEWSFFSKRLKPHKRYVDSHGWTNYDNSYFKGDCNEVIDKGTPLPQEK